MGPGTAVLAVQDVVLLGDGRRVQQRVRAALVKQMAAILGDDED